VSVDRALIDIERACGDGSVLTDPDVLESYGRDTSEVAPQRPVAAVRASTAEHVSAVMRAASEHAVAVTPRGAGTGRVGAATPTPGGLVLVSDRMRSIERIDERDLVATTQPGVVLGDLHRRAEEQGVFFPPDPNSLDECTIGGNVATNAGGPRALKYGTMRNWVLGLQVVTGDGTILELGKQTPKGVTGYDLTALVVGSEGTLAVTTRATLKLLPAPEKVVTMLVFLPDHESVERAVGAAYARRIVPRCVEFLDSIALELVRPDAGIPIPENAQSMLLVELDGDEQTVDRQLEICGEAMLQAGAEDVLVAKNTAERQRLWGARKELSYTMRRQATNKLSEDVCVPRTRIAALLDRCARLSEQTGITMPTYGHAGDGNLHVNFLWDRPDERPQVEHAIRSVFEAVLEMGGTLSGEHGIGLLKVPYLHMEQPAELISLQEQIKGLFDPKGILNPDKCFPEGARRFHGAHGAC
jgi:glycolate oxidase